MENITISQKVLKKYFFADVLMNEGFLSAIGTFETGVITGDQVGLVSRPGYIEAVAAGCNPTFKTGGEITNKTWTINNIELPFKWCADDVAAELKRNQDLYDLTRNDAYAKIIKDWMGNALVNSALCLALFGDTTSATNGLKLVDGILKAAIAAGNRTQVASGDQTMANMIANTTAVAYLQKMILDAPVELRAADDAEIIMTQAMWDAINYNTTVSKGIYIETQWNVLYGGIKETTWNGYRVVVIPALDKIISSVANNVLSGYPYFAMFTTKSNIRFGSSNTKEAGLSDIDVWYNKDEKLVKADATYSMGTMLPQTNMVQLLY